MGSTAQQLAAELLSKDDPTVVFDLIEELAVGSFGSVYKGTYKPTGEIVAVKVCQLEDEDSFTDLMFEISILRKCEHPNIVKFFGAYQKGDEIYIAMELAQGGAVNTLYEVLDEPLEEDVIAYILQESLKGLEYMHDKAIIHRDIKAANILLTSDGAVKLADFGVSAVMKSKDERRNTFVGTPYWMAPEIVNTKDFNVLYDRRVDIWALGITTFELAELNPPLSDIPPMKALFDIPRRASPKIQDPENWTEEFLDFVHSCVLKDTNARKDATEMLAHPFLRKACTAEKLVGLIEKVNRIAEEFQEGADDSDEDFLDGLDTARQSTPSSAGHSPVGTPSKLSMALARPPTDYGSDASSGDELAPPSARASHLSTGAGSNGTGEKISRAHKKPAAAGRGTIAYRPKTQKDAKGHAANQVHEKMLGQNLRKLRIQQKKQQKDVEEMQKVHATAMEKIAKKQQNLKQQLLKTNQTSEQNLLKKQKIDKDNKEKSQKDELRILNKGHVNELKLEQAEILKGQKAAANQHKAAEKTREKEEIRAEKQLLKTQQKTMGKKDLKELAARQKEHREFRKKESEMAFNTEQTINKESRECTILRRHLAMSSKAQLATQRDTHDFAMTQQRTVFQTQIEAQESQHKMEQEQMDSCQELELRQISQQCTLINSQLTQNQMLETDNLQRTVKLESKLDLQAHRQSLKKEQRALQKRMKEGSKTLKGSELKQFKTSLKEGFTHMQQASDLRFQHTTAKNKRHQELQLELHHTEVSQRLQLSQYTDRQNKEAEHFRARMDLRRQQLQYRHTLLEDQHALLKQGILKQHSECRETLGDLFDCRMKQLAGHHVTIQKTVDDGHQAQQQLIQAQVLMEQEEKTTLLAALDIKLKETTDKYDLLNTEEQELIGNDRALQLDTLAQNQEQELQNLSREFQEITSKFGSDRSEAMSSRFEAFTLHIDAQHAAFEVMLLEQNEKVTKVYTNAHRELEELTRAHHKAQLDGLRKSSASKDDMLETQMLARHTEELDELILNNNNEKGSLIDLYDERCMDAVRLVQAKVKDLEAEKAREWETEHVEQQKLKAKNSPTKAIGGHVAPLLGAELSHGSGAHKRSSSMSERVSPRGTADSRRPSTPQPAQRKASLASPAPYANGNLPPQQRCQAVTMGGSRSAAVMNAPSMMAARANTTPLTGGFIDGSDDDDYADDDDMDVLPDWAMSAPAKAAPTPRPPDGSQSARPAAPSQGNGRSPMMNGTPHHRPVGAAASPFAVALADNNLTIGGLRGGLRGRGAPRGSPSTRGSMSARPGGMSGPAHVDSPYQHSRGGGSMRGAPRGAPRGSMRGVPRGGAVGMGGLGRGGTPIQSGVPRHSASVGSIETPAPPAVGPPVNTGGGFSSEMVSYSSDESDESDDEGGLDADEFPPF
eukprot:TRINITY_DN276_c0_g1_i1.p1 TRINITY_DN276_c0_g1~~TRINITY_DN276_c0_g1_i1.p1  ORF type:complete len:1405 (+),score=445.67 TRINITY_DN276_c0_g1_i1:412-4626(+)